MFAENKQTPTTPYASALVQGQTASGVFRGCWSFDCSGMGMMMGGSDCGLPMSSLRTVGGLQDTDGDGLADVDEYRYGTNIFLYDTDGDGLNDALEIRIGSCPTMYDPDSDGDGMADVWEEHFGFNPQNPVDANADPDKDSLVNRDECFLGTNPIDDDTDADGLRDGQELKCGTQPCNLQKKTSFMKTHYFHSHQFRSNVIDTIRIWERVKAETDLIPQVD